MSSAGSRPLRALLAVLIAGGLAGCLDRVDAFVPPGPPGSSGDTTRLTFNPGEDRSPAWIGNDTILYAAAGFDPFPLWPGLVAELPRTGGVLSLAFPSIQSPIPRRFTTPVLSPTGDRIAFIELTVQDTLCAYASVYSSLSTEGPVPAPPPARLVQARIIVRARSSVGPLTADPQLVQAFAGVKDTAAAMAPGSAGAPNYVVRYYPFQKAYNDGQAIAFRPSWSPDGQKLVYSDGLQLLVWTVGQPAAVPLPGGAGGTSPAWSPRGDQIAFSRPVVSDSSTVWYQYVANSVSCGERRIRYNQLPSRLMVVAATGGTPRDLGEGDEPAWSPDAATLYARNWGDEVIRIPATGGAPVVLSGLRYSNDLAVSPDGRWLAFTRAGSSGSHDLWLAPLSH